MSLIEKAEEVSDADQAEELERKIRSQEFTLEDFLAADAAGPARWGRSANVLGMMPGMGKAMKQMRQVEHGRARARSPRGDHPLDDPGTSGPGPSMIDGSRRKRIARGSGTTVQAVNQLVKQFGQMRKLMAQLAEGKMPDPQQLLRGMR